MENIGGQLERICSISYKLNKKEIISVLEVSLGE